MDQPTLFRALGMLGVQAQTLENLRRTPFQQAVHELKLLQEQTKAKYKKLAFELHPDRTGGDEEKTKLFSEVTEANRWFQDLKMAPAPPQPVMRVVRMVHYPAAYPFGGTATSTSTSTSTHSYNAARVVHIKVCF